MFWFITIIFLVLADQFTNGSSQSDDYEVQLVQVLFRHGDRTITTSEIYPKDPYNLTAYYPYGLGQLTTRGKKRMQNFGKLLRQRYEGLIPKIYRNGLIRGYSTNVDRTKMSLRLVLDSLLPFELDFANNWSPIPNSYNFDTYDFLSTAYHCPKFELIWNATVILPKIQRELQRYRDFIRYLSNSTGLPDDPNIVISLHENIHSQMNLGLKYPDWCNDEVYDKLKNITAFRYDIYVYNDKMKKIAVGPTIRRFLRNIKESETDDVRIHLYSAHDDNVATFIRVHGFEQPRLSDYGSAVLFEKLKNLNDTDTNTYVRLLYYPGEGDEFQVLKLEQCSKVCPLAKYMKIIKESLPVGEGTQCLYKEAYKDVEDVINGLKSSSRSNILKMRYVNL